MDENLFYWMRSMKKLRQIYKIKSSQIIPSQCSDKKKNIFVDVFGDKWKETLNKQFLNCENIKSIHENI